MKFCKDYCGIACINGTCPMANSEEYEERCIPLVANCGACHFYRGCEDCYFNDEENKIYCGNYIEKKRFSK